MALASRRQRDYDPRLLPNPHLATLDGGRDVSPGYPAWNLLYYTLLCSITYDAPVVVETGTNRGLSTIVMAQALRDLDVDAAVETVELNAELSAIARDNVAAAGLTDHVRFHVGDSVAFLAEFVPSVDRLDFAYLDARHRYAHVMEEINLVCPKVSGSGGKVYFDNTQKRGIRRALDELRHKFDGNLVEFDNCSWAPPGNAIWQPSK